MNQVTEQSRPTVDEQTVRPLRKSNGAHTKSTTREAVQTEMTWKIGYVLSENCSRNPRKVNGWRRLKQSRLKQRPLSLLVSLNPRVRMQEKRLVLQLCKHSANGGLSVGTSY